MEMKFGTGIHLNILQWMITDLYGGIWWDFNAGAHDWMHSNAFHFDEVESVIYVSHRHLSRISKIAYPSGDVIWNIGMPAAI